MFWLRELRGLCLIASLWSGLCTAHHARAQAVPAAPGVVNLNTATAEELDRLPGIGPTRARAILELRARLGRFRRIEDLMRVKGIGRATFRKLRPLITLEGVTTLSASNLGRVLCDGTQPEKDAKPDPAGAPVRPLKTDGREAVARGNTRHPRQESWRFAPGSRYCRKLSRSGAMLARFSFKATRLAITTDEIGQMNSSSTRPF
jgi:comEA protein